MKSWKKVEVLIYENEDGISRIEYKDRIIQSYGFQNGQEIDMCHFVLHPDGDDDKEFLCLLEAIKYIDKCQEMKI